MEPESSLPHLQVPATCPYSEPAQSTLPQPTSWRSICILSSHRRLGFPSGLFHSGFPIKSLYTPLLSSIRATLPAHLDFVTRTILGAEYKSLSSSLCSFLHFPVTSTLLGSNTLLAPYSQTPSAYVPPPVWVTKFHTHTKQQDKQKSRRY